MNSYRYTYIYNDIIISTMVYTTHVHNTSVYNTHAYTTHTYITIELYSYIYILSQSVSQSVIHFGGQRFIFGAHVFGQEITTAPISPHQNTEQHHFI